jgi:thiol-disulfide isomerase/thioredoxin
MLYLTSAVVLVGTLCALDLILTLGVIKRLREHTELLTRQAGGAPSIEMGEAVGRFATTTVDGETLTPELVADDTVVAFFSTTCAPCRAKLPRFAEAVRERPGGRERVLAVVAGDDADSFVSQLNPVARVVTEGTDGAVGSAFKVQVYPLLLVAGREGDGELVVTAVGIDVDDLAAARV